MVEYLENTCNMIVRGSSWRQIQVSRGEQALGSLWWVKQAFHLWRDLKDREARETGQKFRTLRRYTQRKKYCQRKKRGLTD